MTVDVLAEFRAFCDRIAVDPERVVEVCVVPASGRVLVFKRKDPVVAGKACLELVEVECK